MSMEARSKGLHDGGNPVNGHLKEARGCISEEALLI